MRAGRPTRSAKCAAKSYGPYQRVPRRHGIGRAAAKEAEELVGYVHESLATEVILGHRRRSRWRPGDTTSEVIRRLSGVDVHILRHESEVTRQ